MTLDEDAMELWGIVSNLLGEPYVIFLYKNVHSMKMLWSCGGSLQIFGRTMSNNFIQKRSLDEDAMVCRELCGIASNLLGEPYVIFLYTNVHWMKILLICGITRNLLELQGVVGGRFETKSEVFYFCFLNASLFRSTKM